MDFVLTAKGEMKMRLIDCEKLLVDVDAEFHKTNPAGEEQIGFLKCRKIIRDAPTIEAEPVRHRTWVIKTHNYGYGEFEAKHCPDCDRALPTEYDANYCPNCGAKMDGKEK